STLFTEERLVVVGSVHRTVVQQPRDPAKAYQPESAIRRRARRAQRKKRPPPPVDRQILNRRQVNVRGKIRTVGGDDRSFGGCDDRFGLRLHPQTGVQWCRATHLDGDARRSESRESPRSDLHRINARREMSDQVTATTVSRASLLVVRR